MRKLLIVLVALLAPAAVLAGSWENASLVDQNCKEKMKGNYDKHPTSCLLKCAGSGYGIVTADGKFLKLDEKGNQVALAALKSTKKTDGIRVSVKGEQKGDTIAVESLAIPD